MPRKSLHRTVFRAWLLLNQERNRRWLAVCGRLAQMAGGQAGGRLGKPAAK